MTESETLREVLILVMDTFEHDSRLEKEARTLLKRDFRVTVLAWDRYGSSKRHEVRDGMAIIRVGVKSNPGAGCRSLYRVPMAAALMLKVAVAKQFGFVVAHGLYTWPIAWLLQIIKGSKSILDARDPYAEEIMDNINLNGPSVLKKVLTSIEGFFARRGDVLMTVTPLMIDHYCKLGVKEIYYLPNVPMLPVVTKNYKQNETSKKDVFIIGRVGGISPGDSGIEALVEVGRILNEKRVPFRIVLGGPINKGWDKEFTNIISTNSNFMDYLGPIKVADLGKVISGFDLMADLSEPVNGNSMYGYHTKIFDAMAQGVPVLTTRAYENGFLVDDTSCGIAVGYPFNFDEICLTIETVISDRNIREEFSNNGLKATREKYSWSRYEQGLVDLFR